MTTVQLIGNPSKKEIAFDYFFDRTLIGKGITLLGAFFLCIWGVIEELIHPNSFFEFMENRRIAEENASTLIRYRGEERINYLADKNNELKLKWNMVIRAITFHLHSGRYTTQEQHQLLKYKDVCERVREFFKRNNIDLYSEDFDPEYVAKCIREQEIC